VTVVPPELANRHRDDEVRMHLLGIRREDRPLERRVPLVPEHVPVLRERHDTSLVLQSAPRRIFPDEAFVQAGARVDEDLGGCNLVLGIKEIPPERLLAGKAYLFFSHVIKGQPANMPMLRRLLELGCTLIDYEKVTDDAGRRLLFFGRHAGIAGMIDTLWCLGQRLALDGHDTPFARLRQAITYESAAQAVDEIRTVRDQIRAGALPPALHPLVIGIAGYGNTSRGAQEVAAALEPTILTPEQLLGLAPDARGVFLVVFREEHMVEPLCGSFDLADYFARPGGYRAVFEPWLDRLTVLLNCIYWDERYPRLVGLERLQSLFAADAPPKLRVIGDVSCDVGGAIEATVKATYPDDPVYVYDVRRGEAVSGFAGCGPVILAVYNLPAEVPKEASELFSEALLPLLPALAAADYTARFADCRLPAPVRRAVIAYRGDLTGDFAYLSKHL
jgi:alpha-aminoadipic semialdehyde synthase